MDDIEFSNWLQNVLNPLHDTGEALNGRSLKDLFETKLKQLGLTKYAASTLLNIERKTIDSILDKTAKRIDVVSVIKLSHFLNISTNELLGIYLGSLASPETIGEIERTEKLSYVLNNFDLVALKKAKFIQKTNDINEIENRIKKFFGLTFIHDYSKLKTIPAFSKAKKAGNLLMVEFWVRSAYEHFKKMNNPNIYDRDKLVELLPKIRPYTSNVSKGLKTVTQALYNIGITVIYQPYFTKTQVKGATFVVNGKPCIVLTDLNKHYATLWFSLIHELHHVLYDLSEIESQVFHLSGELDLFLLQEDKADLFAREFLFSSERAQYIYPSIDSPFVINQYADECQIHPSLIYTFYCWDTQGNWGKYNRYLPDVSRALVDLNVNSFQKESIEEAVQYLKENIFNF